MTNPIPMPFHGKEVPHLVIEVNQQCNLTCASCYKHKQDYSKPLSLIKREIDFGARERNLDVITIAGGEPTLHPDLLEIIRYIRTKGIKVFLLTNGIDLTDEHLRRYRQAGLSRVMLHVDSLQGRPDAEPGSSEADLNAVRERLMKRVARHGLAGGLALTAYQKNKDEIPDVLTYALRSPWVSAVLITCCNCFSPIAERHGEEDLAKALRASEPDGQELTARELATILAHAIDLEPVLYVESNLRETEWRWLLYAGFAIDDQDNGVTALYLSSRYRRTIWLGSTLQKLLKGRYKFDIVPGPIESFVACVLYALLGLDRDNLARTGASLFSIFKPGARIRSKVFIVQQAPNLSETGEIEHCKNCPDATVRNGKIVPLCLADILSPIEAS